MRKYVFLRYRQENEFAFTTNRAKHFLASFNLGDNMIFAGIEGGALSFYQEVSLLSLAEDFLKRREKGEFNLLHQGINPDGFLDYLNSSFSQEFNFVLKEDQEFNHALIEAIILDHETNNSKGIIK